MRNRSRSSRQLGRESRGRRGSECHASTAVRLVNVAIDSANVKRPRDTAAVKKAYVVYNGHVTGVFKEWGGPGGAARSVHAYSGSSVKGFPTLQEAQRNWDDYNEVKSQGAGLILDPFRGSP